jgi:hypothetical protein
VQVCAEGVDVVAGVADERGEGVVECRCPVAADPVGEEGEQLGQFGGVAGRE